MDGYPLKFTYGRRRVRFESMTTKRARRLAQTSDASPRKSEANIDSFVNVNVPVPGRGVDGEAVSAPQRHCPANACFAVSPTAPHQQCLHAANMQGVALDRSAPMQMSQQTTGFDPMSRRAEMPPIAP